MDRRKLTCNQRKVVKDGKAVQKGPARRFFSRFKGRLAAGTLSLALLGSTAAVSGCSEKKKEAPEQIVPKQKSESGKGFKTLETKGSLVSSMPMPAVKKKKEGNFKDVVPKPAKKKEAPKSKERVEMEQNMLKAIKTHNIEKMKEYLSTPLGKKIAQGDIFESYNVHTGMEFRTSLLIHACAGENADVNMVKLLIDAGANVNYKDSPRKSTALHTATYWGQSEIVELLVKNGANVNVQNIYGDTPLMNSANHGDVQAVKFLLKKGADVNLKDKDGETALFRAAMGGKNVNVKIMELLLKKGADVNEPNEEQNNALMKLIDNGGLDEIKTIKFLLENGSFVALHNDEGKTAMMMATEAATEYDYVKLFKLLSPYFEKEIKMASKPAKPKKKK